MNSPPSLGARAKIDMMMKVQTATRTGSGHFSIGNTVALTPEFRARTGIDNECGAPSLVQVLVSLALAGIVAGTRGTSRDGDQDHEGNTGR